MSLIDFWLDFDSQHATFSEHSGGLQKNVKRFMPGGPTDVATVEYGIPLSPSTGPRIVSSPTLKNNSGLKNTGRAIAPTAKLLYDISLFANRAAITTKVRLKIGTDFNIRIRACAPEKGRGGVLISYMVDYRKQKDPLGSIIGTLSHQGIGILGAGPNASVPYKRVFSPQQATISSGKKQVAPPKSVNRVACFMWVFRN